MQQNQTNGQRDQEQYNSALGKVIERNICTLIRIRTQAAHQRGLQGKAADAITSFSGTNDICSDLEMETKPEDVLAEIHCLQQREYDTR